MGEGEKPPELKDLDARLEAAKARREAAERPAVRGGIGAAVRVAVDLVAGIAVGVAIGYFLDRWLDTRPWMLILFFILGAAAGFRNVFRAAQRMEAEAQEKRATGDKDRP